LRQTGTYDYEVHVHDQMWVTDDDSYARLIVTDSGGAVLHDLTYHSYSNRPYACFNGDCGEHVETIDINEPNGFTVTIESRSIVASARSYGCQTYATWSDLLNIYGVTENGWYQKGSDIAAGDPGSSCTTDDDCNQSTGVAAQPTPGGPSSWDGASCVTEIESGWCRAHSTPGTETVDYEMDSSWAGVTATTCQY
jgi:hypothetical protein